MDLAAASAIFARYAHQFVVAYVFGSVAAGTADEHSDIDVIVVRHTTQPFFDRVREIMELRLEFGAADMLIYTPAELEQMLAENGRYVTIQPLVVALRGGGIIGWPAKTERRALPDASVARLPRPCTVPETTYHSSLHRLPYFREGVSQLRLNSYV